jgi:hypothetical protein
MCTSHVLGTYRLSREGIQRPGSMFHPSRRSAWAGSGGGPRRARHSPRPRASRLPPLSRALQGAPRGLKQPRKGWYLRDIRPLAVILRPQAPLRPVRSGPRPPILLCEAGSALVHTGSTDSRGANQAARNCSINSAIRYHAPYIQFRRLFRHIRCHQRLNRAAGSLPRSLRRASSHRFRPMGGACSRSPSRSHLRTSSSSRSGFGAHESAAAASGGRRVLEHGRLCTERAAPPARPPGVELRATAKRRNRAVRGHRSPASARPRLACSRPGVPAAGR